MRYVVKRQRAEAVTFYSVYDTQEKRFVDAYVTKALAEETRDNLNSGKETIKQIDLNR